MSAASSDTPCRNRSSSLDDAGLREHERKRPRLTETQTAAESSLPQTRTNVNGTPASDSTTHIESAVAAPFTSSATQPHLDVAMVGSPTSKVTINTRPLSSQSISHSQQSTNESVEGFEPTTAAKKSTLTTCTNIQHDRPSETIANGDPETISISSTDSKSPEIEVAEVDNFDRTPGESRWTSLSGHGSSTQPLEASYVRLTFPFNPDHRRGNVHEVLKEMTRRVLDGHAEDALYLREVKLWLREFLSRCDMFREDILSEDTDFWYEFHGLLQALLKRQKDIPAELRKEDLLELFDSFTRLTALFMQFDLCRFRTYTADKDPRQLKLLLSTRALLTISMVLGGSGPFFGGLRRNKSLDPTILINKVAARCTSQNNHSIARLLPQLLAGLAELLPRRHSLSQSLIPLVRCMCALFARVTGAREHQSMMSETRDPAPASIGVEDVIKDTFRVFDLLLETATLKQHSWLSLDVAKELLEISSVSYGMLLTYEPALLQDNVIATGVDVSDMTSENLVTIAYYPWRFKVLHKFITQGRMELRVYGVERIGSDLVEIWQHNIQNNPDPLPRPIVNYCIRFIQSNKVIEYVIGVDSHSQLVQRSASIIGFLGVTKTYTEQHTDIIWKAILDSEDQRRADDILKILSASFQTFDPPHLMYICDKLIELPFDRFDNQALIFTSELAKPITDYAKAGLVDGCRDAAMSLRKLCVQLLLAANTHDNFHKEQSIRIRDTVSNLLKRSLQSVVDTTSLDWDETQEAEILSALTKSIRSHDCFATGSIMVISILLSSVALPAIGNLVEKWNFTELLILDLDHLNGTAVPDEGKPSQFECDQRIHGLFYILAHMPDAISNELADVLWKSLLTSKQLPDASCSQAWATMTNILSHDGHPNSFLQKLANTYLPILEPAHCTKAILEFIEALVNTEVREAGIEDVAGVQVVELPGIERIWHIMLEAVDENVQASASNFIMKMYLDNRKITTSPVSVIEATHLALVDRGVRQVMEEAQRLCLTKMDTNSHSVSLHEATSASETSADRRRFHHSLLFLRKFSEGMKAHPKYNDIQSKKLTNLPKFEHVEGEPLKLKVQFVGSKYISEEVQEAVVGSENTCTEFAQYLAQAAGMIQVRLFHLGSEFRLDHDDQRSLATTRLKEGLLIVKRMPGSPDTVPARAVRASSPVDSKIMHHFDDLYQLLDAPDDLAREVYNFLVLFSAQEDLASKIKSMSLPHSDLLPPARPYRLMYCARALKSCVEEQSFNSAPNLNFLLYSVHTVCDALTEIRSNHAASTLHTVIACDLLEVFVLALRAKVDENTSKSFIVRPEVFTEDLTTMIKALLIRKEPFIVEVHAVPQKTCVRIMFEALVEATLHDSRLWQHLNASNDFEQALKLSLLDEKQTEIRQTVLDVIQSITGPSSTKVFLKVNDTRYPRVRFAPATIEAFLIQLWTPLTTLVSPASYLVTQCHEAFETLLLVLKRISKVLQCRAISVEMTQWSGLILDHKYQQSVGHPLSDFFVGGMARLLCESFKLGSRDIEGLVLPDHFMTKVWVKFLFPPLTNPGIIGTDFELPSLDSTTREALYDMLLALCTSNAAVLDIVIELEAGVVPNDYFDTQYTNERLSLRSSVGYAGLRNLSNTCYLNSLFSQLFMNASFREFVIHTDIMSSSTQALLGELAKVFSYMQNSCEKFIDPSAAVGAITTYEGEGIDVSVQMDVDEFFNLLFDRLEGQVLDEESKTRLKQIYGGKLVQQIKSKECEHISEREEPFSAVQVEIRGKANLEESLRAYVEGEVLQGDNKYSCTTCQRHVDAVKRACLKVIPDNLIFNLKRFDYDILTGLRQKVNDEFSFPQEINMTPYKLDQLMDPGQHVQPDVFELVGIIVHSGTADSGHYYSFIRQRPSSKDQNNSWVQFNDHDVSPFDPASIPENCYGGVDESPQHFRVPRFYNAYMLFYQRKTSIQQFDAMYQQHDFFNPVHLPLRPEMEQHLVQSNELYLRTYCAQDPTHAKFMRQLLERAVTLNQGQCSSNHDFENRLIGVVLDYVQQVSSRWKERPEVELTMNLLHNMCSSCVWCAETILSWLCEEHRLRDMLLRSCMPSIRGSFAALFLAAFTSLAKNQRALEEIDGSNDQPNYRIEHIQRLLELACYCLRQNWDLLQRFGRAWQEYFQLLKAIVELGLDEAILILDAGFLEVALELIEVHTLTSVPRHLRHRYNVYMSLREKNRFYGHAHLMTFLARVLQRMDLSLQPSRQGRVRSGDKAGPSMSESDSLGLESHPCKPHWLFKVIVGRTNSDAATHIVGTLSTTQKLMIPVKRQLDEGLGLALLDEAASFIRPTIMFLQECPNQNLIVDLLESALDGINSIGVDCGKDYLLFVQSMINLRNDAADIQSGALVEFLLGKVGLWAPPLLVYPADIQYNVSAETVDVLKTILLTPLDEAINTDPAQYRVYRQYVRDLAEGCIRYVTTNYLSGAKKSYPSLSAGQAHHIAGVISHCTGYFNDANAGEEEQVRIARETVANLQRIAERAQREESVLSSQEWEAESDEMEALSDDYNADTP